MECATCPCGFYWMVTSMPARILQVNENPVVCPVKPHHRSYLHGDKGLAKQPEPNLSGFKLKALFGVHSKQVIRMHGVDHAYCIMPVENLYELLKFLP